jgi:hypothetical protein
MLARLRYPPLYNYIDGFQQRAPESTTDHHKPDHGFPNQNVDSLVHVMTSIRTNLNVGTVVLFRQALALTMADDSFIGQIAFVAANYDVRIVTISVFLKFSSQKPL